MERQEYQYEDQILNSTTIGTQKLRNVGSPMALEIYDNTSGLVYHL